MPDTVVSPWVPFILFGLRNDPITVITVADEEMKLVELSPGPTASTVRSRSVAPESELLTTTCADSDLNFHALFPLPPPFY